MHRKLGATTELAFDTPEEKAAFDAWAKKHGSSASPFLICRLRDCMESEQHPRKAPKGPTDHELREQIASLQSELHATKAALARAEARIPAQEGYVGDRYLQRQIVGLLKGSGAVPEMVLFSELDIAAEDGVMQALVLRELEELEGHGRVRKSAKGWRWLE